MVLQLLYLSLIILCSAQNTSRISLPAKIIRSADGACPPESQLAETISQLKREVLLALSGHGLTQDNPAISCSDLPANSPSGFYWILPAGPPAVQMYCDFNRQCGCDGVSTWTRVAFLNMSDPNQVCPSIWITITSPVRACGKGIPSGAGCNTVFYPTSGLTYNRVCGRVIAYQQYTTAAFRYLLNRDYSIEQFYVEGVSLTHGSVGSRQHIWSFASTLGDNYVQSHLSYVCDCSSNVNWPYNTSFIGNDYFCDSGNHGSLRNIIYSNDPLWDGEGCGPFSSCCQFNNPPWFCKTLPQPTTDDLEVRICEDGNGDTPIQLLEIYVQ